MLRISSHRFRERVRKQLRPLLACPVFFLLIALSLPAFGQEDISGVMDEAVRTVSCFVGGVSECGNDEIENALGAVDSVLTRAGQLSEYQVWTLQYIRGYLYYVLGIAEGDRVYFGEAKEIFYGVNRAGTPEFDPAKREFAGYMAAWCDIRAYHSGGGIGKVDNALRTLRRLPGGELENDIEFLRGYAYLVKGADAVASIGVTEESYRAVFAADSIFSRLRFREDMGKVSSFYHLYGRFLLARFEAGFRIDGSRSAAGEQRMDERLEELESYSGEVAEILAGTGAASQARYIEELSLLYRAALRVIHWIEENRDRTARLDQEALAARYHLYGGMQLDLIEESQRNILSASRALIANRISAGGRRYSGQSRFWHDLSVLNRYLQADRKKYFSSGEWQGSLPRRIFATMPVTGKSSGIDSVLARKRALFGNYCNILSARAPEYPEQGGAGWMKLLSRVIPLARRASGDGRKLASESNIEFLLSRLALSEQHDRYITAGDAAMAIAGCIPRMSGSQERSRRVLFTTARMLMKAAGRAGTPDPASGAETALKYAFALINSAPLEDTDGNGSPDNRDALELVLEGILADSVIESWPAAYRNEALYYRAVMERQVRGRFLESTRDGLSRIAGSDPRAAYIMGYEAVSGSDAALLDRCRCLVEKTECSDWILPLLEKAGASPGGGGCASALIGPAVVRYDMLRAGESECNFTRSLILKQVEDALKTWSACVSLPELPFPWSTPVADGELLRGPAEFAYLRDEIRIGIDIRGADPSSVQATVMSDLNTVVYQGPVDRLASLRSGRRYILIFSGEGLFPTVIERTFQVAEEVVTVEMTPAYTDYSGDLEMKESKDGRVVFENGGHTVTMGPAGLRYRVDGKERIGRPEPGQLIRNISKFALCRGRIYAFDNRNGEVIDLSYYDEGNLILDLEGYGIEPSDISSDGKLLYIADEKRGIISTYHPDRKAVTGRVNTGVNPALITVTSLDGRVLTSVWDRHRGLLFTERGRSDFVPASGMEAAALDGMNVPFRLSSMKTGGMIVCRNNLFDRKLFLFLPTGGYAGSVLIPEEISPPYYFADYSGPVLKVGSSNGIVEFRMSADPDYRYRISGPVSKPERIEVQPGGWFTSRGE